MHRDIQESLEQVLAIERQADAIVEEGRARARSIRIRATQEADALQQQLLNAARQRAEEIVAAARAEAERERERQLARVDREVESLQRSAQERLDLAVREAVARLLGEKSPETAAGATSTPRRRR